MSEYLQNMSSRPKQINTAQLRPVLSTSTSTYIAPPIEVDMSGHGTAGSPIELELELDDDQSSREVRPISRASKKPLPDVKVKKPNFFNDLPIEIFDLIVTSPILSNVDRQSLKMTSRALQTTNIVTTDPTKGEFRLFNKQFEASIPHFSSNPLSHRLLCHQCHKFLPRSRYPDACAQGPCKRRPRTCLRCAIKSGELNKRCFLLDRKKQFVCEACKECKVVETEMATVQKGTEFCIWQKFGEIKDVELKVGVFGRRWCKTCWKTMDGFWKYIGEVGKMKERWHYGRRD